MYNKEAKKRVQFLYTKLTLELGILQNRKEVIDQVLEAIENDEFNEAWEDVLKSLETPRL